MSEGIKMESYKELKNKIEDPNLVEVREGFFLEILPAENAIDCFDGRSEVVNFLKPIGIKTEEIFEANNITRKTEQRLEGAERIPGASFGKVMVLATALSERLKSGSISSDNIIDLIREFEESEGREFLIHDDATGKDTGCGHIDKAIDDEDGSAYGLPGSTTKELLQSAISRSKSSEIEIKSPMMIERHDEVGILIVDSEDETVSSVDDGGNHYFRFDRTRFKNSLDRLAEFLGQKGFILSGETLEAIAWEQMKATIKAIGPDLPVYEITIKDYHTRNNQRGLVKDLK